MVKECNQCLTVHSTTDLCVECGLCPHTDRDNQGCSSCGAGV